MLENKRIIFFDGDGTLWYPKATKNSVKPHEIYKSHPTFEDYKDLLTLTPSLIKVLKSLRERGMILIAVSTHPHPRAEADVHLRSKMAYLGVDVLFDEIHTARPFPWGKGRIMESVLRRRRIPKTKAVLVGDSYEYDYLSARRAGIESLLIRSPYLAVPKGRRVRQTIGSLRELIND